MTNNKKVLYFEGAGWAGADSSKATNVGNCRIRTAFTNNEGRKIYLELLSYQKSTNDKKIKRYEEYQVGDFIGWVDFCFYIDTESKDPCNEKVIREVERNIKFNYSIEGITEMINKHLNCSFESIEVLPNLAGYRVHGENRSYNLADEFIYNKELTEKRIEIEKYFCELEKSEGKQYPNFSVWVDENNADNLHLLRHFNGYNKHWSIQANEESWINTVQETTLGKYGC